MGSAGLTIVPTGEGVTLAGEVDMATWATLSSALHGAIDGGPEGAQLILDLTDISFIDGHGAWLIAEAARGLGPSRRLVLRGASPMLLRVVETLHLDREPGIVIEGSSNGET